MPDAEKPDAVQKIYRSLSNLDSMFLFNLAVEGIEASTGAEAKYGLTHRRYYKRLKELTDSGLITKQGGKYVHTTLGSVFYESQLKPLRQILLKRDTIQLLEKFKSTSPPSEEGPSKALQELEDMLGISDLKPVRIIKEWDEVVATLQRNIETMNHQLLIATRYADFRTVQSTLQALKKGAKINVLHGDRGGITTKVQLIANLLAQGGSFKKYLELVKNPNVDLRHSYVPYSFFIIDETFVGIEIVNPASPNDFFIGISFENAALGQKMSEYFNIMWEKARKDPMDSFFGKPDEEILKGLLELTAKQDSTSN
ncbi:MAG: hypothetical protein HYU39_04960 [Thaumarchaeota archaeon]|nr:hypothetical protein [Nitrososphaerota archaeon]